MLMSMREQGNVAEWGGGRPSNDHEEGMQRLTSCSGPSVCAAGSTCTKQNDWVRGDEIRHEISLTFCDFSTRSACDRSVKDPAG